MSILNVCVEPRQALIGVDTATVWAGTGKAGPAAHVSKMSPLVHINSVLGMRGNYGFFSLALSFCYSTGGTFDDLTEAMPWLLQRSFATFLVTAPHMGLTDDPAQPWPLDKQEIVFVGWSIKQGRMIGTAFTQLDRAVGFVSRPIDGIFVSPGTDPDPAPCYPNTHANMVQLARFQKAMLNEKAPGAAAGGRFIIAKIVRDDSMTIAPACDLDA